VLTSDALPGLLAEPARMKVLAAVALGAGTDAEIAQTTGLAAKQVAAARRKLEQHGLLGAGPAVDYAALTRLARDQQPADEGSAEPLAPFVQGDRLLSLPAAPGRRREVLEHVAERAFDADRDYDEPAVNDRLHGWCDGGEVDHAALRRYLVESGLLARGSCVYRLASDAPPPEPSHGERLVRGLGLS
jgi:hypothetical protein